MNRPLKNVLMFLVMAGLLFTAVSVFLRDKSRVCTKGSGPEAIAACGFMIQYFTRPKKYIWKRVYEKNGSAFAKSLQEAQKRKSAPAAQVKIFPSRSQLKKVAWVLDTKK